MYYTQRKNTSRPPPLQNSTVIYLSDENGDSNNSYVEKNKVVFPV